MSIDALFSIRSEEFAPETKQLNYFSNSPMKTHKHNQTMCVFPNNFPSLPIQIELCGIIYHPKLFIGSKSDALMSLVAPSRHPMNTSTCSPMLLLRLSTENLCLLCRFFVVEEDLWFGLLSPVFCCDVVCCKTSFKSLLANTKYFSLLSWMHTFEWLCLVCNICF